MYNGAMSSHDHGSNPVTDSHVMSVVRNHGAWHAARACAASDVQRSTEVSCHAF